MSAVPDRRLTKRIGIRPASGAFAAEITGVDLSQPLDDELSDVLKEFLGGLKAEHNAEALVTEVPSRVQVTQVPPGVTHPVVRTHPGSGRKALFVNPYYTSHFIGMTREESAPILGYLYERATRHENIYRHSWRKGDVLMWDNRCTMHYAVRDYDENMPRYLHRTTAAGERPI